MCNWKGGHYLLKELKETNLRVSRPRSYSRQLRIGVQRSDRLFKVMRKINEGLWHKISLGYTSSTSNSWCVMIWAQCSEYGAALEGFVRCGRKNLVVVYSGDMQIDPIPYSKFKYVRRSQISIDKKLVLIHIIERTGCRHKKESVGNSKSCHHRLICTELSNEVDNAISHKSSPEGTMNNNVAIG